MLKTLKDKKGQEGRLVQKENDMNNEKLECSYLEYERVEVEKGAQ